MNPEQMATVLVLGYLLAPLFLIMPLMFAGIVGSESFVGEKERKTLEALLHTPASDRELFLGKVIASVVPALLLSLLCFAAYAVVLNIAGWPTFGRVWFPLPHWLPLMLWVAPAVATLGMAASVIVSSRVSTFMEAYQFSGALLLPLMILFIGQIAGAISLSVYARGRPRHLDRRCRSHQHRHPYLSPIRTHRARMNLGPPYMPSTF